MTKCRILPVEPTESMTWAAVNAGGWCVEDLEKWQAMLAAAPSPWISVEERLPEPEVDALAFVDNGGYKRGIVTAGLFEGYGSITLEGRREGFGWASWESEEIVSGVVTHWMPLPEAPEVAE